MRSKKLTQKRLKEVFSYDKNTGIFTRLISTSNRVKIGETKTKVNHNGYIEFRVDGKKHKAHRLAFLYVKGIMPDGIDIDHKDRIKHHNWWSNLRLSNKHRNAVNRDLLKNNRSGVTGVCYRQKRGVWEAQITSNRNKMWLGSFKNKTSAVIARRKAEIEFKFDKYISESPSEIYLKKRGLKI